MRGARSRAPPRTVPSPHRGPRVRDPRARRRDVPTRPRGRHRRRLAVCSVCACSRVVRAARARAARARAARETCSLAGGDGGAAGPGAVRARGRQASIGRSQTSRPRCQSSRSRSLRDRVAAARPSRSVGSATSRSVCLGLCDRSSRSSACAPRRLRAHVTVGQCLSLEATEAIAAARSGAGRRRRAHRSPVPRPRKRARARAAQTTGVCARGAAAAFRAGPAVCLFGTTLSQAWSRNSIRGPQCAFEMSMFMCPAVHKLTRN